MNYINKVVKQINQSKKCDDQNSQQIVFIESQNQISNEPIDLTIV